MHKQEAAKHIITPANATNIYYLNFLKAVIKRTVINKTQQSYIRYSPMSSQ